MTSEEVHQAQEKIPQRQKTDTCKQKTNVKSLTGEIPTHNKINATTARCTPELSSSQSSINKNITEISETP